MTQAELPHPGEEIEGDHRNRLRTLGCDTLGLDLALGVLGMMMTVLLARKWGK